MTRDSALDELDCSTFPSPSPRLLKIDERFAESSVYSLAKLARSALKAYLNLPEDVKSKFSTDLCAILICMVNAPLVA